MQLSNTNYFVHPTSVVDEDVEIGEGTKIWHFSHIQSGARIGKKCSFGQNVNVANNVHIGDGVKVQNNVSIYEGVELEDYVFCGPSCVFTNDLTPRARLPKGHEGYKKTLIKHDATLGANCTVVCGNEIGEYALVASGAVVTKNVEPHAVMAGVPAKRIGWACECGQVLDSSLHCKDCGKDYEMRNNTISKIGGVLCSIYITNRFKEVA
jgi:UDP-2-acetamido-3-amino-2,3-dideoxy-glucuronate N-acetyltransferase